MIRETYKGRKLKVVKGRGADFGHSRVTLNGVEKGRYLGDEDATLRSVRGTIDHADQVGINGDRYGAEWYAPGTFELCGEGHPKEIGGECLHSWCMKRHACPTTHDERKAVDHAEPMDFNELDDLIANRGLVRISERHGWAAGATGIAMGYRAAYDNVKVGFVDAEGNYTGEYTMVHRTAVSAVSAIEPRGTVYDWYDGKAWTRVMGGRVHHFWIGALPAYWAEYWGATVEVTHYSHPYGNVYDRTPVRRVRL